MSFLLLLVQKMSMNQADEVWGVVQQSDPEADIVVYDSSVINVICYKFDPTCARLLASQACLFFQSTWTTTPSCCEWVPPINTWYKAPPLRNEFFSATYVQWKCATFFSKSWVIYKSTTT